MKSLIMIVAIFCVSCASKRSVASSKATSSSIGFDRLVTENKFLANFEENYKIENEGEDVSLVDSPMKNVYEDIINLFNPNDFDCGCTDKLKKNILKIPNSGFVPKVVTANIPTGTEGRYLVGRGSNILVHTFQLVDNKGIISKKRFNNLSPSTQNYNALDNLLVINDGYDNFYYSIDCSGYLAGVISAGADVKNTKIELSAENASRMSKSLIVIKGLLYSPMYQAVKNEGLFISKKEYRKAVLQSILNKIPSSYTDDTKILINSNYEVILISNQGSSSYNGKAETSATGSYNFLVGNAGGSVDARGNVGRTSNFARYNTYILDENKEDDQLQIKISDLKLLISSL